MAVGESTIYAYGDSVWELSFTAVAAAGDDLTEANLTFSLEANSQSVTPNISKTEDTATRQVFKIVLTTTKKTKLLGGRSSTQVEWRYSISAAGQANGANVIGPDGSGYQGKFTLRA